MSKETEKEKKTPPRKKRTFKNFADYWHFVKPLTEEQRKIIVDSLTKSEQRSLQASYKKGGWEDLFMRNQCDKTLDIIKEKFGVDLLLIRTKIISGKPQLVQKAFWEYIKTSFDAVPWQHISYIFDGIVEENSNEIGYVKLKMFAPSRLNEEEENDDDEQE